MSRFAIIKAARGEAPADLLLTNARIVNVFTAEVTIGSLAVALGRIVGLGNYASQETIDLGGRYLVPGFIDAHVHIESSLTCISEFARAVVPRGTTSVVADPHEIANVLGAAGIDYMLRASEGQPMNFFFGLPSCVPATPMETAGAELAAEDLVPFFNHPRVVALGEMMNYPGVIFEAPDALAKIAASRGRTKPVDGHAPGLGGRRLNAYLAAGIDSDHECTSAAEAREKLAGGMHIMVREGTGSRNLLDLLPVVNPVTSRRMMFCSDDPHAQDLVAEGHLDAVLRKAIAHGLDPLTAIQMATINPADYFRMDEVGAIAPGRWADLVVLADLKAPKINEVFSRGRLVAAGGKMFPGVERPAEVSCPPAMQVDSAALDFAIPARPGQIRVIRVVPHQVVTGMEVMDPTVAKGRAVADPDRDLLKIAVVERHHGSGRIGKGFVTGLGLAAGALAGSVAHDHHNIIVVGAGDADMLTAVNAVAAMGGGLVVVQGGRVQACLALPIAGLMSPSPLEVVHRQMVRLLEAARELGTQLDDPFAALSFLGLPVIPHLKITDRGLVDVDRFQLVELFVNPGTP